MAWKNQNSPTMVCRYPGQNPSLGRTWARSTYRLFAVLLLPRVYGGALKPFDLKGLFCSGFFCFVLF